MNTKVKCPLMNDQMIDDVVCFDIHCVVEGDSPERFAPKEAIKVPGFRQICLSCPNHRFD